MKDVIRYLVEIEKLTYRSYIGGLWKHRQTAMMVARMETKRTGIKHVTGRVRMVVADIKWFDK